MIVIGGDLLPNVALPIPTRFLASPAKTLGGFGLVWRVITIPYHRSDLAWILPCITFTNHYHREGGQGIDLAVGGSVVVWASVARVM